MKYISILSIILFSITISSCASITDNKTIPPPLSQQEIFVNKTIQSMSLEEMIGQLIIIGSDADISSSYIKKISQSIDSLKIGGICFFKGSSKDLIALNEKYSKLSKLPLLFSIDGEWGLGMRLTDGYSFPRQITLGSLDNSDTLLYEMGKNIALQAKSLGLHLNFAPSVDINLNPNNPIIGSRSFGEDKYKVAKYSWSYLKGMQDNGLLGSLKHFPGHGDTETDSHHSLPVIKHSKLFIDTIDSYPFRYAIEKGTKIVMIGHLNIPSLIQHDTLPASLSKEVITDYLKKEIGFSGIVITDALNMKAITNTYKDGEAEVMALVAGVDILLMPQDEYKTMAAIFQAIKDKRISKEDIEKKCRKVLNLKYELGLFESQQKDIRLPSDEIINQAEEITNKISQGIITLVRNNEDILPIIDRKKAKISLVQLDETEAKDFIKELKEYNDIQIIKLKGDINDILFKIEKSDYIIALMGGDIRKTEKDFYGINKKALSNLKLLQEKRKIILALFTNPYSLKYIDSLTNIQAVVLGYENLPSLQREMAKTIFGHSNPRGKLPITASKEFTINKGLNYSDDAIGYVGCVDADMNPSYFKLIDSIAEEGIKLRAYPGCQIVVMHNNKIAYKKSYGYLTYDSLQLVTNNTIYDVASVTKVMATTLSMMKLFEEGKYSLDDTLSFFLPYLKGGNKSNIKIREVLAHNAGLKAWEPFYKYTIKNKSLDSSLYSNNPEQKFKYLPLCNGLWIKKNYTDSIFNMIANSPLNEKIGYLYSDFGFILLGDMIQRLTWTSIGDYAYKTFYQPMGLNHISYNPLEHFSIKDIAPTEEDNYFRNTLIRGYVHDPASAMMGGKAGHAGLFSNAMDIASLAQMLLNEGNYEGEEYLKHRTIKVFNKAYFKHNRRALGFDKPENKENLSPCSRFASKESFGHTGFTGTYFWVEPKENLVFVFLSNRVYPSQNNTKLSKYHIRTNIHDLLYKAVRTY